MMKKLPILAILGLLFYSCATTNKIENDRLKIRFLDEYVIDKDLKVDGTKVGGLSGIDYKNGKYYLIVDTPSDARFYEAEVDISSNKIDTVKFNKAVFIEKSADFFKDHPLDPESIRFLPEENQVYITSEGNINNIQDPSIFILNENGNFEDAFKIPEHFTATGEQKPRHNGVFEGLSETIDKKGIWVSTELPLEKDGPKPKLFPTKSFTRITYFDKDSKKASKQFAYKLDGISKIPWLYFAINGVTEILEYKKDNFLVLERAYSAGHGSKSNTVKIFDVDAENATNILNQNSLKKGNFNSAKKRLVFDFKSVRDQLTDKIIDNIEGICFGPKLPNGKQSLLLISDNNFNSFTKQLTQLILLEIDIK
ncbi:esterase-like activity of phytase family protein [Zunongwangia sp. HGR-M22]|uniref:esterase-like activity of phytase family protein n=1 Tax=Zunongwangia sp. HGR-M22 TaxID=3015168 RepID=UPI0022DD859C|nr:esterase-like activity of phytase family protein [Zunongwangia sp. HGR-M22]WBL26651.1 esterase-like activity of phytase family protein [Zunongwangia sp. HGR-M22]